MLPNDLGRSCTCISFGEAFKNRKRSTLNYKAIFPQCGCWEYTVGLSKETPMLSSVRYHLSRCGWTRTNEAIRTRFTVGALCYSGHTSVSMRNWNLTISHTKYRPQGSHQYLASLPLFILVQACERRKYEKQIIALQFRSHLCFNLLSCAFYANHSI